MLRHAILLVAVLVAATGCGGKDDKPGTPRIWMSQEAEMLNESERLIADINYFRVHNKRSPSSIDELKVWVREELKVKRSEDLYTDPWGKPYVLKPGGPRKFDLSSAGPDRVRGTEDDIKFEH